MAPTERLLREPAARDWDEIAALADVAVRGVADAPRQHEWVAKRQQFRGDRMHVVAESDGKVAGYAAVERQPDEPAGLYRIFLVTNWQDPGDVPSLLYEAVEAELRRRHARVAWLREYASDAALGSFVLARGFEVAERYRLGEVEMVTYRREFAESSPVA